MGKFAQLYLSESYAIDERRSEYSANQELATMAGKGDKPAPARPGDTIHYTNDAGHKQKEVVSHDLGNGRYGVTTKSGNKFQVHHSQVHQVDKAAN